jgi:hypothetical protein
MRRLRLLALLAALPVLLLVVPAEASYAGATHIAPSGCDSFVSTTSAVDGYTRGFVRCASGWRYVKGKGTSWSSAPSPYRSGDTVGAVAFDGRTVFMLVSSSTGLFIKSKTDQGYTIGHRLSTTGADRSTTALIASGNQWWAVWGRGTGDGGVDLYESHTLAGSVAPHAIYGTSSSNGTREIYPALAWQSSSRTAVLVWQHQITQSTTPVLMETSHGGAWSSAKSIVSDGFWPTVAIDGATVAVGLGTGDGTTCRCAAAVATGTVSGITSVHRMSGQAGYQPFVGASAGRVFLAWRVFANYSPAAMRVAMRSGSTWTSTTINRNPSSLDGAAASGGRFCFFANEAGYEVIRSQ